MTAPDTIKQLVERFDQHRDAYRAGKYNETQLRNEFLNPFLEALGWDVLNKLGYSEENKHVIHEDSLEIEGMKKAPDYAFKIGKERKFFVEAKKPSVKIETNSEVAFQLRRYVWSAKLPLGILTDFEEFAVYECRSKPKVSDSVKTGRVMLLRYTDYIEKWDEIVSIFSHDAVMQGGFDKFASTAAKKKGTAEVDSAFLAEIEGWRDVLARNIATRNKEKIHSEADLNYAVQMTIDRMIFLRICEDRGYEPENQLQELTLTRPLDTLSQSGRGIYTELIKLFERADKRYNSGLFHFKKEDGRGRADTFTTGLEIDDKVLKDIIKDLYYPAPYVFALIPANILGQIYEQFLGKVIRLTASGNAKVEEKPEVRKAGGVYYTPTFIVEYIVWNILKRLLAGKTPVQAALLKLLDPACGSGTFLLVAYQYLLDWHLNWYLNNDFEKWSKGKRAVLVQAKDGWKLSIEKKKEILLNNIYGVDIDPQAVEVTKLSLLLKVIEDPGQLSLLDERILPDLGKNIQCGNSLIGPDYWEGQLMVSEEERARVNAFDWQAAFPEVFAQGGFDGVFGNPPYVRQELLGELKDYFQKHYQVFSGTADLYSYFIERGVSLLKKGGIFSYIVANKWMRANYGESLRVWLKKQKILEIIDFGDLPVFTNATTYPCILSIESGNPNSQFKVTQVKSLDSLVLDEYVEKNHYLLEQGKLDDAGWSLANDEIQNLVNKLNQVSLPLEKYTDAKMYRGIVTGYNEAFVIDEEIKNKLISDDPKSAEIIKPFVAGRDVKRYSHLRADKYLIFTRRGIDIKQYPAIEGYLSQFKERLMPKPKNWKGSNWMGRKPGTYQWYEIQDSIDYHEEFEKHKIVIPAIIQSASYTFETQGLYSNDKTSIIVTDDLYLLGILNSKVPDFVMHMIASTKQGGYYEYKPMYVAKLPIRPINFNDAADKACHDKVVSLVERMLALQKSLASAHNPQEADRLTREVESVDKSIDGLVYELYGLSEEEIKIVEG